MLRPLYRKVVLFLLSAFNVFLSKAQAMSVAMTTLTGMLKSSYLVPISWRNN